MISNNLSGGLALRIAVGIMMLVFFLLAVNASSMSNSSNVGTAQIEGFPMPNENGLLDKFHISGMLEANATQFEIKNSSYLNVTLDSSEPIVLTLESAPEMVTMHIESASGATSAKIILGGFLPFTTYHKYEDDYHNHTTFTTDANGSYPYTQDLSNKHLVFIQPRPSTKFINDNSTGGDCISIGSWNSGTKTCTLTNDLSETIEIDSDDIILNGNGHTITGSNTGNGVYLSSRTGVTIKNLNVKEFYYGINFQYSSNNILINNTVSSLGWGSNAYGITLASSSNNTLTNNTAISNAYGISLASSSNNTLTNNTASLNGRGIDLQYSNNNTFTGNNASWNSWGGIYLQYSSNNTLTNNLAILANTFDYQTGIRLQYSNNNTLTGNNASWYDNGIVLEYSSNNTLTSNTAIWNEWGITLTASGSNILINNTISWNSYGITLTASGSNILINNTVSSNGHGISVTGSSNNNTLTYNNASLNNHYGIELEYSSNNTLTDNIATSNFDGIYLQYSSNSNILIGNTASLNSNYGIFLSSSGISTLANNSIAGNGYNFALFGSTDSDFDNTIYTNNTVDGKPVLYIKNASDTIYDSSSNAGIFYCIFCSNVTIKDLTFTKNGYGIFFWGTNNSKIENINANWNRDAGIQLTASSNNTLTGNNATFNGNSGISLTAFSNNNTLNSNIANENDWGSNPGGIYLSSSSNNTLTSNTASLNGNIGMLLDNSNYNILTNNNVSSNNYGIILTVSSNNTLTGNTARFNQYPGIYLQYSSNNNSLTGNNASSNFYRGDGICLSASSNNTLTSNTANSNAFYGIALIGSSNNTLTNNTANSNNVGGIRLVSSNDNTLTGNTESSNNNGITIDYSSNNTISGDNASNNGLFGFSFAYSNNNTVTNDTASNNGNEYVYGAGINLDSSSNNSFYNNFFNNTNYIISGTNYWNTANTSGKNIVGGPYLGGNFWAYPNGTGFSQTCPDVNKDGICDSTYLLDSNNIDYLPLARLTTAGITVFYPNGGEILPRGTTQTIRWNYTGSPGPFVNISLLKGGVFNRTINSSVPIGSSGSGSYNWLINSTQTPGTDYKVRITSITNATYIDTSDNNFTLLAIPSGYSYIYGKVINDSVGIAGALVTTNASFSTTTDTSGLYSLLVLAGNYNLTTTKEPAYYKNSSVVVNAIAGTAVVKDIMVIRKLTGTISGTVRSD